MIGIIGALQIELDLLISRMEDASRETIGGFEFFTGTLCGRSVVLSKCGVGKVNAAVGTQTMILTYRPSLVINTGVAGGLTSRLHIGDIAVARDLVQHDVDTSAMGEPVGFVSTVERIDFPCADWAVAGILSAVKSLNLTGEVVRIATGDQFIEKAEDKARIVKLFQADACEMEGCAIAQTCWIARTDCAVIRAISDAMDGEHHIEYEMFAEMAARNSANVLMRFLESVS